MPDDHSPSPSVAAPAAATLQLPQWRRFRQVDWVFAGPLDAQNWPEGIVSGSVKKLARRLDEIIASAELKVEFKPLTTELYTEWLEYYAAKMREQNHDVLAKPEWWQARSQEQRQVWLCDVMHQGERVGTAILSATPGGRFTEHFKASDRFDISNWKNASLGVVIDLLFIRFAAEHGAAVISSGKSRNAFGFFNNLGYLAFKLKMGYRPQVVEPLALETDFPYSPGESTVWFATPAETPAPSVAQLEILIQAPQPLNSELLSLLAQLELPTHDLTNQ